MDAVCRVFYMKRGDEASHSRVQTSACAPRAALYMRVSTGPEAEHDLSIPDQRRQLESWCRAQGCTVASEFIEGGASAGDDRRPVFQQMIERACDGEQAFDLILVHSYSRFFREAFEQEFYLRKLAKHGVRRSEEHTSELQSLRHLVCRLLLEKKKK